MMAHVSSNGGSADPAAIFEQAKGMLLEAYALEAEAIRRALERTNGLLRPAARILGVHKSTLVNLMKGRHRALADEARAMRKRAGYAGDGRPSPEMYEEGGDDG